VARTLAATLMVAPAAVICLGEVFVDLCAGELVEYLGVACEVVVDAVEDACPGV
jgi:hypothetical protein